MSAFHFLRPEWFLALIPVAIVLFVLWKNLSRGQSDDWRGRIDSHLLKHLTVSGQASGKRSRTLFAGAAIGFIATVFALAGPAWEKLPTPTGQAGTPTVVVMSLSQSMNGDDLVPSRLTRAGHKLQDVLARAEGAETGLVIYADRPFVASPLTRDGEVIAQMLPELSTSLMPVLGNRLDLAIDAASDLLTQAGAPTGRILVMADDLGVDPEASFSAAEAAKSNGYDVNVLGVGTLEGAVLRTAQGQAITQNGQGEQIVVLDEAGLENLARAGGGSYARLSFDGRDLDRVLSDQVVPGGIAELSEITADKFADRGYLLALIPAVLLPFAFRRGVIFAIALGVLGAGFLPSTPVQAGIWRDLWATPDQQGAQAFEQGDFQAASTQFENPDWRAGALYRDGSFDQAALGFAGDDYNTGNALAMAGRFEEALAAYDAALAIDPEDQDAQHNRDIVEKLLEQQQEQQDQDQQQDQQQQSQSGQEDQSEQQESESQQNQDQQSGSDSDENQNAESGESAQDQQAQDQQEQDGSDAAQQNGESQQAEDQQNGDQSQSESQDSGQEQAQSDASDASGEQQDNAMSDAAQGTEQESQDLAQGQEQQPSSQSQQSDRDQIQSEGETSGSDPADPQTTEVSQPEATGEGPEQDEKGGLGELVDRLLEGDGTEEEGDTTAMAGTPVAPISQASEQELRAVPDNTTGLLKARINAHYSRLLAAQNGG